MDEEKAARENSQAESQEQPQARSPVVPAEPSAYPAARDVGWASASTSQVVRTVAAALLTAVVVLAALFLLWKVRTFVGWFVIALFLTAVLNPAVNWLQRRHRLIKRPLAIALIYVGLAAVLLFVVGIFLPLLVDQINGFIRFVNTAAQAPEGPTEYIKGLLKQNGLGGLVQRFDAELSDLRKQLGEVVGNLFSATGQVAISAAGFLAALATVLTLTFFLILGGDRYVSATVGLFAERHRPLVRRILGQAAGAVSGYVTGNLAISLICGVTTFVVLLLLGMPYAAPLALLVAVLDLVPLGGDSRWSIARDHGVVRRAVESGSAARFRAGLPAGGEQPAPTAGLQPGRPTQRTSDPDRAARGRATAGHPRGALGHPGGRDHPHIDNRDKGLPADDPRSGRDRRRVSTAACYPRLREDCHVGREEPRKAT